MSGFPGSRKTTARDYIGTCVSCRHGIYRGDTHHRGRGLWLGLLCATCHHTLDQTGATR